MLSREIIEKTEVFLKRKFDAADYLNAHPEAKAYRIEHTYRVANIGRELALKEGFDETEMVIACLLHDVSYCEEFGEKGWIEHGRRAAHIARPFLSELGLAEDRINDICYGIAIHVDEKARCGVCAHFFAAFGWRSRSRGGNPFAADGLFGRQKAAGAVLYREMELRGSDHQRRH